MTTPRATAGLRASWTRRIDRALRRHTEAALAPHLAVAAATPRRSRRRRRCS